MYALSTILVLIMLYNCRIDIRKNQLSLERIEQSAERIAQMATEVSTKTDEILNRQPRTQR
jgi:hypothetical protein